MMRHMAVRGPETFRGWNETYRVANDAIAVRVVADVGPRVVELGPADGPSLLYLRQRELGGHSEPVWRFRGGWRLWTAPEDATTYALDNLPGTVTHLDDRGLTVVGPVQPEVGLQKSVGLRADAERPRLLVESRLRNVGEAPVAHAPWTLAALRPGGRAFVPLDPGDPSAFADVRRLAVWSYARLDDPRYAIGRALVEVDHRRVVPGPPPDEGATERRDDESKIGVDSAAGWAAYLVDDVLLVTRAEVVAGPRAAGTTIEVYSCREFIELEHLGVVEAIGAGGEMLFREDWWLFAGVTLPEPSGGSDAVLDALRPYVAQVAATPL
jgi:hypothetical protein